MTHSPEIKELAIALCKVQAQIEPAIKNAENPAFKRGRKLATYADLTAVWEACRPALTANGFSVVQYGVPCEKPNHTALATLLLHETGQWIEGVQEFPLSKTDPQGVGSATTYARRYGLAAMIGVIADEDDDGNKASDIAPQVSDLSPQSNATYSNSPAKVEALTDEKQAVGQKVREIRGYLKLSVEQVAALYGKEINARMSLEELIAGRDYLVDLKDRWEAGLLRPEETAVINGMNEEKSA